MSAAACSATYGHGWKVSTTSSATVAWGTPPALYAALDKEFGFTIDVAADAALAKHPRYFDKDTDALAQSWAGLRVFCNPPYGRELPRWVRKARLEVLDGACPLAVLLVPARTGVAWYHDEVMRHASEVRFIRGRLNFSRGGAGRMNAPFDSMVVVFRADSPNFAGPQLVVQRLYGFGGRSV